MPKLMKCWMFALLALGMFQPLASKAVDVYVTIATVDGTPVSYDVATGEYYIRTKDSSSYTINYYTCENNKNQTFVARVPSGHDVTGWSYGQNEKTSSGVLENYVDHPQDTYDLKVTSSTRLLAVHFDWLKYALQFDGNGSTSGSAPPLTDITYTNEVTLAANPFEKTGYSFSEWKMKGDGSRTFADKAVVKGEDFGPTLSYTNKTVTLVAQWTPNKYTVTFDANGGVTPSPSSKSVTYDSTYGELPEPTFAGHAFAGWYTEASGGTKIESTTPVKITEGQTLYARWTSTVLTVSFDTNGGAEISDTKSYVLGDKYADLPVPQRYGYTYGDAWWTARTGGEKVTSETEVTKTGEQTLYAHWTAKQCTVTFDPGEMTLAKPSFDSTTVTYDARYETLPAISYRGYDFSGWYTDRSGGERIDTYTKVVNADDHTLYAQWNAQSYYVSLDSDGGTVFPTEIKVTYGTQYPGLPTPTKKGYTFVGWFTKQTDGDEVKEGDYVTIVQSETPSLYARWTPNEYTIAFDANGGTGTEMEPVVMKYDAVTNLPPCTYVNGIRSFSGWIGSDRRSFADQEVVSNLTAAADGVYTLSAQWSEDYVIAFDGNGATSGTMPNQKLSTKETAFLTSNDYARTGYAFLGWATNAQDAATWKVRYADGASVRGLGKAGETVRLLAVWTNNVYRVRFYPNGGEGVPFERTFAYDIARPLPGADAFSRANHTLDGWLADPTNSISFGPSQSVSNLTSQAGVIVPLFAKWKSVAADLGEFSRAADCDCTTADRDALALQGVTYCTVDTELKDTPGANDECVSLNPTVGTESSPAPTTAVLSCLLPKGKGTISFYYKVEIEVENADSNFSFTLDGKNEIETKQTTDDWKRFSVRKDDDKPVELRWMLGTLYNAVDDDHVYIDNVAWLPDERDAGTVGVTFRLNDGTASPADIWTNVTCAVGKAIGELPVLTAEGFAGWSTSVNGDMVIDETWIVPATDTQLYAVWSGNPEPQPEDAPTIGGFERKADGFGLTFVSDVRFDYRLLSTTSLLSTVKWEPYGELKPGTGKAMEFTIPDPASEGTGGTVWSRFFKVEVLRRGAK